MRAAAQPGAAEDPEVAARMIRTPQVGLHFAGGDLKAMNLFPEIGRIRCPTLMLGGELDPITPVSDLEDLAAAIPGSRLEVFPGAGHKHLADRPSEALAIIREFVAPRRYAQSDRVRRGGATQENGRGEGRNGAYRNADIGMPPRRGLHPLPLVTFQQPADEHAPHRR